MAKRKASKALGPPGDTTALFVRLPAEAAERIDRVAFERKIPKKEVIRMLVTDHLAEIPLPIPTPAPAPPPPEAERSFPTLRCASARRPGRRRGRSHRGPRRSSPGC